MQRIDLDPCGLPSHHHVASVPVPWFGCTANRARVAGLRPVVTRQREKNQGDLHESRILLEKDRLPSLKTEGIRNHYRERMSS
jgi:hypothetical protein